MSLITFLSGNFLKSARGLSVVGASFDASSNTLSIINPANNFANDVAAQAGGVPVGGLYHNAGAVRIRIA